MNENYIMLNGKRIDLTEEQLEKLGIKVENKDFFNKKEGQSCYFVNGKGFVQYFVDENGADDNLLYKVGNYCTDKSIMQQRALHETLDRMLWRFSMQNDEDEINWSDDDESKYIVLYEHGQNIFRVDAWSTFHYQGAVYFHSEKAAQRAIDEIILPFMKEHPEFVW